MTEKALNILYLHSTMYLLKLASKNALFNLLLFTFHYVSIKTELYAEIHDLVVNLHSTMYLLKQGKHEIYQ